MKRRVLFVMPSFGIGGTTVSTRNLISILDKEKYDITVWALSNRGALRWMYDDVAQLETCFSAHALTLRGWKEEKGWARRIAAAAVKATVHTPMVYQWLVKHILSRCVSSQKFDTVVACQEGFTTLFVSHFQCENRVAWVRCDYKEYYEMRGEKTESFYEKYNHIVCVAEKTRLNFVDIYPNYEKKTVCIYNPQDSTLILSQADINDHDARFDTNNVTIVSLGRLSRVKRFVEIPAISRKLIERGLDFKWYIIGDGEEKAAIANAIEENCVNDRVVMLGGKSNPHFYIKNANLYVCLSSSEACPRVINEAKILGTPVVSTDFPTVYEYLEDGVNGRIVSIENIPEAVTEMLTNSQLYTKIKNEISNFQFDNSQLIKQLEKIL